MQTDFPVEFEKLEWIAINEKNYQEVFNKLKKDGETVVIFGLSASGFEKLSINDQKTIELINQKNAVIVGYKKYYETTQDTEKTK